jgi:hypothetical protein
MPIQKQADVHVDAVLSNLVLDYGRFDMIGNMVLPKITVDKDTGKYYKWTRNNINIAGLNTRRQDRSQAQEIKLDVSIDSYEMEQHALKDFLEDGIRKNADSVLNLRARYANQVIDIMDLVKEKTIRDTVFDTNNYATANKLTLTGNDRWNQISQAASDPQEDILAAQLSVLKEAGVWPTTLVMGVNLYNTLRRHAKVLASVQYVARTGINSITDTELCQYLGVSKIIVGKAVYNQNPEGASASNAFVWNNSALLLYEPPAGGGINVPAYGYEFNPSHTPRTVSRYTEPGLQGEWVEVNEKRFMKLTFPAAAFLFDGADS